MSKHRRAHEANRGRNAEAPQHLPPKGWKDVLWRTYGEISADRVTLVAAGVTYYVLLALFPALTAFVSLYGLFADPATVNAHLQLLSGIVPAGGMALIDEQLTRLATSRESALGLALLISMAIALWSASAGIKALFEAMNIAYDEAEKRNFFVLNALALAFTLGGVVAAIVMIGVVVVLPLVLGLIGFGEGFEWVVQIAGYVVLLAILFAGISALYRYGPSRNQAKWRWVTPGAVLAVMVIMIVSLLFSWYAANFANYDRTYGSLGALIGLLTWMWISVSIVIVGAELNSETEHQTRKDSTVGAPKPMGQRNATMADTLGKSTAEGGDAADKEQDPVWQEGYQAGLERQKRQDGVRRISPGALLLAVPATLMLGALARGRDKSER